MTPHLPDAAAVSDSHPSPLTHPALSDTVEHVAARFSTSDSVLTSRPPENWLRVADLFASPVLDPLIERVITNQAEGRRDVTGSYLTSWLMAPIIESAAEGLWLTSRILPLNPETVWVHLHGDGWVDGVAFSGGSVVVTPSDQFATSSNVEVRGDRELVDILAERIVAFASPAFAALRRRVAFGQIGMWGILVDGIFGGSMWRAQEQGEDASLAWGRITVLADAIEARVPRLRSRPRPQLIAWSGGSWTASVKGTCCLYYKTCSDPDPAGEGYCISCPFRTDESRATRLGQYLEQELTEVS